MNVGDTSDSHYISKVIFILTNIVYFLPIILYKPNIVTICSFIIGTISTIFHLSQCSCHKSKTTKIMVCVDTIICWLLFTYVIITVKKLPLVWYILLVLALITFILGTNDKGSNIYMLLHSIWHIITGCLLIYASKIYTQ